MKYTQNLQNSGSTGHDVGLHMDDICCYIHIHIHSYGMYCSVINPPTAMFLRVGGKPEEKPEEDIDSNLSSDSNWGHWSYDAATLPAATSC